MRPPKCLKGNLAPKRAADYFGELVIDVNVALRVLLIAGLMPAAITSYSIAVAADASAQNFAATFFTVPPGIKCPDPSGSQKNLEPRN